MTLSEKAVIAANGRLLTPPQGTRLNRSLGDLMRAGKSEDEITVEEIDGLIDLIQTILPTSLYVQGEH